MLETCWILKFYSIHDVAFGSNLGRIGKGKQKWHYLETYEKVLIVAKPKKNKLIHIKIYKRIFESCRKLRISTCLV